MRPTRPNRPPHHARHGRSAFTLIELLVVLGIIALLVSITLLVGKQVKVSSETRFTQDTIRVLDSVMDAYLHATSEPPDPWVLLGADPNDPSLPLTKRFLAADARDMQHVGDPTIRPSGNQMLDGMAVFFHQASRVPEANSVLMSLPPRATVLCDPDGPAGAGQPLMMSVLDAWKRPIRYVHPAFQGDVVGSLATNTATPNTPRDPAEMFGAATSGQQYVCNQIRRNHVGKMPVSSSRAEDLADSDGGVCPGGRPYFYSAGSDGFVGLVPGSTPTSPLAANFNQDNVYTTKPTLPTK